MSWPGLVILTVEDTLRQKLLTFFFVLIVAAASTIEAQQGISASGEQFLGTWTGTWDRAGLSAGFQLTLERGSDGSTVAKVSVAGDPTYQATLAQVVFDGAKMTGTYDFPPQPETEVVMAASFDGSVAAGTWVLREKATNFEVVSGSWRVTKN
jgi:hypothetical protein